MAAPADRRGRVERDRGAASRRRRRETVDRRARAAPGRRGLLGRRRARARLPVLHGRRGHVPAPAVGAGELGAARPVHGGRRLPVDDPLRCRAGAGAVRDLLPHHARPARRGADPCGPRVPGRPPAPAEEAAARPLLDLRARARPRGRADRRLGDRVRGPDPLPRHLRHEPAPRGDALLRRALRGARDAHRGPAGGPARADPAGRRAAGRLAAGVRALRAGDHRRARARHPGRVLVGVDPAARAGAHDPAPRAPERAGRRAPRRRLRRGGQRAHRVRGRAGLGLAVSRRAPAAAAALRLAEVRGAPERLALSAAPAPARDRAQDRRGHGRGHRRAGRARRARGGGGSARRCARRLGVPVRRHRGSERAGERPRALRGAAARARGSRAADDDAPQGDLPRPDRRRAAVREHQARVLRVLRAARRGRAARRSRATAA